MAKIYLYLARRDKGGLRLVSVFEGPETPPTRLADVKLLRLPDNVAAEIARTLHDNRMYWEPWVESASGYEELKKAVRSRGFTNVPAHGNPLCPAGLQRSVSSPAKPVPTMIRKFRPDA